ncbi:MAG: hypothetical protein M1812_006003 [Candelaria pacifica]|nr:MAG: hypothetical protein M1812_006003 [Candelaria pacifica]
MSTGVDMNLLRHQCLRSLIRLLGEWEENLLALDRILDAMTVILDPWGEMDDGARSAMERIASLLMMRWKNGTWNQGSEGLRMLPIWPSLVVPTYKLTATIPNFRDSSNMQTLAFSLLDLDIMRDPGAVGFTSAWRRSILSTFKQSMQSSDGQEKLNTLSELGLTAFDNEASISRLQLLGVLVATIDDTGNMPIELRRKLSNTFVKLCDYLPGANLVSRFSLTINIMEMMMRKKSWVITQWSIDNALQSIAICCSPTGPKFETPSSGSVFLDLTRLLGNILAVHRQKLGGRFHLVILVMQGLLRCLFAPLNRGIVRLSNTTGRPPWLESKSANLGAEEAGAYSKLLTTLCDPTVSSVTSSRNRLKNELSDETKKAKAIVGQYLPYVLMEYTQCQLRFRMPPEVKAALMPGLHAVFDVMAQDTMRTLNAAMDSSNRAIFKDLYNDYRRFGKWKEK